MNGCEMHRAEKLYKRACTHSTVPRSLQQPPKLSFILAGIWRARGKTLQHEKHIESSTCKQLDMNTKIGAGTTQPSRAYQRIPQTMVKPVPLGFHRYTNAYLSHHSLISLSGPCPASESAHPKRYSQLWIRSGRTSDIVP